MELSNRSSNWLVNEAGSTNDDVYSALALGLMAATTPAWTERYVELLDRAIARVLADRPVAANDRTDPLLTTDRFGYAARVMLLLGVRSAVRRDAVWNNLTFTALSPTEFTWTSAEIADLVASRLLRPNDCTDDGRSSLSLLAAASLGLQLVGHAVPEEAWPAIAGAPVANPRPINFSPSWLRRPLPAASLTPSSCSSIERSTHFSRHFAPMAQSTARPLLWPWLSPGNGIDARS